eukprot:1578449-Heterocapsa_arctica.AAC.1
MAAGGAAGRVRSLRGRPRWRARGPRADGQGRGCNCISGRHVSQVMRPDGLGACPTAQSDVRRGARRGDRAPRGGCASAVGGSESNGDRH